MGWKIRFGARLRNKMFISISKIKLKKKRKEKKKRKT